LEVALVRPAIPPNVGNAARTCAAFEIPLHLIAAAAVRLDDAALRRAGVDTWAQLEVHTHDHLAEALALTGCRPIAFTVDGDVSLSEMVFEPGDLLVFGPEDEGLGDADLEGIEATRVRIPHGAAVRCLNLASSVAIGVWAAWSSLARAQASSSML
jgi:tRNA (cytidine/uridine-2'-O-)-methyltransferase